MPAAAQRRPIVHKSAKTIAANALRVLLVCYTALVMFPVRYHVASVSLDPSWAVALNLFPGRDIVFGRDVAFTYGPLAYLTLPMAMDSNLSRGVMFQLGFWILFLGLLTWFAFARKTPVLMLTAFAVCLVPGSRIIHEFGYAGPDFFIGFVALMLLGAAGSGGALFLVASIAIAAVAMLVKASTGIAAFSAIALFPAAVALTSWRKGLRLGILAAVAAPLFVAGAFLAYHPSMSALLRYLRASFEITSGHSSAMSQAGETRELAAALLVLASYAALVVILYVLKQPSFAFALACTGPLFLEFKHSFVRQAGHLEMIFDFVPLVVGLVLLLSDPAGKRAWILAPAVALVFAPWYSWEKPRLSWSNFASVPRTNVATIAKVSHLEQLRAELAAASADALRADRLPAALLDRLGDKPVTIFPWECSYAAANPAIRYRPLPVFQTYSADSTYPDLWNASFLSAASAPEFILFDWQSIDGRHPLLDNPATTVAMYEHYRFDGSYGPTMLLRKRNTQLDAAMRLVQTTTLRIGQPLEFPRSDHPVIAKVFLKFNWKGRLLDFFFRVPEMRVLLSSEGSRFAIARIPPLVLPDGILINALPLDMQGMRDLFERDTVDAPFNTLMVAGAGGFCFQPAARVEVYELPGVMLNNRTIVPPDLSAALDLGPLQNSRIEALNARGLTGISPREVVEVPDTHGFVTLQGWAADPFEEKRPAQVLVLLDGRLYPAEYGGERRDIASLLRSPSALRSNVVWSVPVWKLGTATHELDLRIVSPDGKAYHTGPGKVRFRVVPE